MRKKFEIGFISVMIAVMILCLTGCAGTGGTAESTAENRIVYEAIFLDNEEISALFASVRGEVPPFDNVTQDFHVTTEYMPEQTHPEWYGEKVSIHITAYAVQDIAMEDGQITSNEGFKAEVTSENEEFASYLASLNKNYHITGAYKDGAQYTEYIDFSEGEPMDVYVTGTFGGSDSDGIIRFNAESGE